MNRTAAVVVILAYSAAGGTIAGVYTDLVQGALMLVTAVALFALAMRSSGGWTGMLEAIAGDDRFGPASLDPVGTVPLATTLYMGITSSR